MICFLEIKKNVKNKSGEPFFSEEQIPGNMGQNTIVDAIFLEHGLRQDNEDRERFSGNSN